MCVALPDCIRKQGSRLRSPTPSPRMKIRFAWPHPIVARGESGRAGMPADHIRFAWPYPIVARGESGRAAMPADHIRFACRFGLNRSPSARVGAMSDAG